MFLVRAQTLRRTRPKNSANRGGGGRGKKGDPLSQAQAELSHAALPVVVGMQVSQTPEAQAGNSRQCPRAPDFQYLKMVMYELQQYTLSIVRTRSGPLRGWLRVQTRGTTRLHSSLGDHRSSFPPQRSDATLMLVLAVSYNSTS